MASNPKDIEFQTAEEVTQIVRDALREDVGKGDITSSLCRFADLKANAAIIFKGKGIVCGLKVMELVFKSVDRKLIFKPAVKEGAIVKAGKVVAYIEGKARSILTAERTALNFLGHLSGIATQTHRFVNRIKLYKVKIMDTRKTTPNMRRLEKYAVRVGGGHNHRMGLYDQVLIKDNHIKVGLQGAGNSPGVGKKDIIKTLVTMAKRHAAKGMKVEVEVENLNEFKASLESCPDIIMLDNMSVRDISKAVKMRNAQPSRTKPLLEASGGITLKNVRKIARTGVDIISIGSLTHSVRSLDVSLEII